MTSRSSSPAVLGAVLGAGLGAPPTPAAVRPRRSPQGLAALVLVAVTASWGATFPLFKGVLHALPAADFLAVRFVVAAASLTLVAPVALRRLSRREVARGAVLGAVYGLAQVASTVGLARTSASVSGFVTGLYVVLTPVLGLVLLRRRPPRAVWVACAVATVGLGVLGLHGAALGPGVPLTLVGALLYALHVLGMGQWARARNAVGMTVVQLWVVAAVCTAFAAPGGIALPATGADWAVVGYGALVSGALALIAQTWAQAHLAAERAAVIMTAEPLWAAVSAVAFGGDAVTPRLLLGGALVIGAMYGAELAGRRRAGALPSRLSR